MSGLRSLFLYYLAIQLKGSSCSLSISGASTWGQGSGRQAKPGWAPRRRPAQVPARGRENLQGWGIHHLLTYIQVSNSIEVLSFRNFLFSDRFCTNCIKDLFIRRFVLLALSIITKWSEKYDFSLFFNLPILLRHGLTESWSGRGQNTWCGGEGTRDHPPPQRHTPLFAKGTVLQTEEKFVTPGCSEICLL